MHSHTPIPKLYIREDEFELSNYLGDLPRGIEFRFPLKPSLSQSERLKVVEFYKSWYPAFWVELCGQEWVRAIRRIEEEIILANQQMILAIIDDYMCDAWTAMDMFETRVLKKPIDRNRPLEALQNSRVRIRQQGSLNAVWSYRLEGNSCIFRNKSTKQEVEVKLDYPTYGVLEPLYLARYIRASKLYPDLDFEIMDYEIDGATLLQALEKHNKLAVVHSCSGTQTRLIYSPNNVLAKASWH